MKRKCRKHPRYQAKRKPRTDCPECWDIWDGKKPMADYEGMDRAREIRLNRVDLDPNGKGFAEVLFWGDVHYGHPQCQINKARKYLDFALKNNMYVLLMGDLLECGLRDSVGDSVYQQTLNPQRQMEDMVEMLTPLADAGRIIGFHTGNHEVRITKNTSVDVAKIMAKLLGVPYLGYACWNLLKVGKQNYTVYSNHGSSGSRFKHTKLKAVMDLTQWIDADVICMGHVHSLAVESVVKQSVNIGKRQVVEKRCNVVLTGSFIGWDKSYAQMKNMPITRLGSPTGRFWANKHDSHFSI